MTTEILTALSVLTKPLRNAIQTTQQEVLVSALQKNQDELKQMLDSGELKEASCLLEEVRREVLWYCTHTEDPTWSFVQECLLLLLCLSHHLTQLREAFDQEQQTVPNTRVPDPAPPLSPDVLSVAQQKTLGTVLQFLVTLGLCPYLAPGVGLGLSLRSAFGAAVEGAVNRNVVPSCERRLLVTTTVFLEVAEVSSLATLVFTRHLGDLMAALCQLGFRHHRSEGDSTENKGLAAEDRKTCKLALQRLLGRVYQPIVVKELLLLQGGPKAPSGSKLTQAPPWLRRLCGQLLSERLMQPHGVQAVVRAILEGSGGGDSDWRKCDAVAKILATCPQQSFSAENYYSQVCPQVLDLFHFKDKVTAQQFQRVATRVALTILQDQPEFAQRFLLSPLLYPLQRCASVSDVGHGTGQEVVAESELGQCMEDVYKICVVANSPSGLLLSTLRDLIPTVFNLFCFTKQNVSHLRTLCQEILLWYLSHSDPSSALSLLRELCVLQRGGVTHGVQFSPGSEGGVRLIRREPDSDEDDALYEKVSGEQWRVECLVQLLAEMKDGDLPGDFFLLLLQDLTDLAGEQQEPEAKVDTSSMTLLELEQHLVGSVSGCGQSLALLQTLAVMCEGLPHTLLLHKTTQVVSFIEAMLQRVCVTLEHGSGSTVESQTLSMGMGLVATLLSGAQLTPEDYSALARLLSPLEQVSQLHPDPTIQELALDLRATIATHGAYHLGSCTNTAQRYSQIHSRLPGQNKVVSDPQSRTPVGTIGQQSPRIPSNPSPVTLASSSDSCATKTDLNDSSQHGDANSRLSMSRPGNLSTNKPVVSASATRMALSDLLIEACDPDVPTRAVALRTLTQAVKEGDKEALEAREKLLALFLENLEHEDSFVYLSAIQGLALLADSYPEPILMRLLMEYQSGPGGASSRSRQSLETRLKVGEALMRASRAMGELAPHYGHPLIGVFLSGTRDEDRSIRSSCLSNLGELCQRLNFSLGALAHELSACLTALIKSEKEPEVRRAAVHVIVLLLKGLSDKTTQILGDIILELYRTLKWVVRFDSDQVTVLHAQLALEELDEIMRRFIFPKQKLEKKIVVLP